MNKLYCANTSCAKANMYEAVKPKFCAHCGQPFSGGFNFTVAHAQVQSPAPAPTLGIRQNTPSQQRPTFQQAIIDDEQELDFTAFRFGVKELGRKMTLGDIQNGSAFVADSDRPAGNDMDIEQVKRNNLRRFKKSDEPTEVQ